MRTLSYFLALVTLLVSHKCVRQGLPRLPFSLINSVGGRRMDRRRLQLGRVLLRRLRRSP